MFKSLALAFAVLLLALPARAQVMTADGVSVADVSILPGWRTDRGTHMTALRVQLAPGWKTYWRAPGDAGIPPRFDWTGSRNIQAVAFHWPLPGVFVQNGYRTIGYKGDFVLPIELTPQSAGQEIEVRAAVELGVCYDVCVPVQVTVAADLPKQGETDSRIRSAISNRPFSATEASVAATRCEVTPIKDGLRVSATLTMPPIGGAEIAVLEHRDQQIWVSEADVHRLGNMLTAEVEMVPPNRQPFSLNRSDIVITVLTENGPGVEIVGCTG